MASRGLGGLGLSMFGLVMGRRFQLNLITSFKPYKPTIVSRFHAIDIRHSVSNTYLSNTFIEFSSNGKKGIGLDVKSAGLISFKLDSIFFPFLFFWEVSISNIER